MENTLGPKTAQGTDPIHENSLDESVSAESATLHDQRREDPIHGNSFNEPVSAEFETLRDQLREDNK